MVTALDSLLKKSRVRLPDVPLSDNNLGQLVPVSLSSIIFRTGQGAVMPCGWEGNRRSDVALTSGFTDQWFLHPACGLTV